ncbi:QRFP-like peptide receptor [Actinia tenebrosa]|uniref:QRFP-like peptide receptor n=1 Tax=Actinia tenebrosa TaxID=6105 RepID=A0A6P8HAS7_ACTTE|nr:QRFP-like peptide receptor [Actinia tenebrosa]XP_031552720.1 QRFP-like peptide receptor [Actinia tenebrosa]XP_031552721.1 QRFP-like peptide receptor [Actinia tenebrosa]XP_031552722.1 QRFP-like peptide receptor [Actinia tenebrosa]XP_031552723.1 QRFP-like peptide receptor [Actinia tenebrosa]
MNNTTNITASDGEDFCDYTRPSEVGIIVMSMFYIVMTILSLTGNILVIQTVAVNRRMHTVTNYLIINMAVADLLLTVFNMPSTTASFLKTTSYWVPGKLGLAMCKLIPFIQAVSVGSSVWNMNAIALDRFFAVVFPIRRYVTFPVAYGMMVVVWTLAIGISAPILYAMNLEPAEEPGQYYCGETWNLEDVSTSSAPKDYTIALFLFFYAIPLLMISVLYSFIIYKLWIRKLPGQRSETNEQRADKSKKKVLKMLLIVVVLFAICWLPLYVTQFMYFFGGPCGAPTSVVYFGYFIGHANSAINPCIYVLFNENFRKGFRDALLCRCQRRRIIPGASTIGIDNTYIDRGATSFKLNVVSPARQRVNDTYQ